VGGCGKVFSDNFSNITAESEDDTKNSADAEIAQHASHWTDTRDYCCQSAKFHIFHTPLVFFGGILDHNTVGQLRHAGSLDNELSCHVLISTLGCTIYHQRYTQIDR